MFTSLPPPAWMIRSGLAPVEDRLDPCRGRGRPARARPQTRRPAPTTRSRSLPLTWIGTSRVSSTTALGSTSGQRCGVDRDPWLGRPPPGGGDQSSSVMCGAAGASISSSEADGLVPLGRPGDDRPAVAHQRVGQLHELGDHRVEVEGLVVGGHVAQRPVGRLADGGLRAAPRSRPPAASRVCGSPGSRPCGSRATRPDPVQEAMDATDPGRAPRPALVPRAHEHQEQADGVGSVAGDEVVGVDRCCRATSTSARRRGRGSGPG